MFSYIYILLDFSYFCYIIAQWKLMNYYSDTFETQIHIQTQIRKTFILALAIYDFL